MSSYDTVMRMLIGNLPAFLSSCTALFITDLSLLREGNSNCSHLSMEIFPTMPIFFLSEGRTSTAHFFLLVFFFFFFFFNLKCKLQGTKTDVMRLSLQHIYAEFHYLILWHNILHSSCISKISFGKLCSVVKWGQPC